MLGELKAGGKRAIADALSRLETAMEAPETARLLDAAAAAPLGVAIGLTGPPGVGKSTLTDALIRGWRERGKTVAVLAVDPSSTRTGGALLGDRTRITTDPADQGVFVRSMAARDRLGGLAAITLPATVLMRALYDIVLVETVGIGQSETEIAATADLVVLLAQPGSGDALQYMKSGIMEVPDFVIVTKADMGATARRTVSDLKGALSLTGPGEIEVESCSAVTGEGVDRVLDAISALADRRATRFEKGRAEQIQGWTDREFRRRFGDFGVRFRPRMDERNVEQTRFSAHSRAISHFETVLTAALT